MTARTAEGTFSPKIDGTSLSPVTFCSWSHTYYCRPFGEETVWHDLRWHDGTRFGCAGETARAEQYVRTLNLCINGEA